MFSMSKSLPYILLLIFLHLLLCLLFLLLILPFYSSFTSSFFSSASASISSSSSFSSYFFFSSASSSCRCLKSSSGKSEIPYLVNQYILPLLYLQTHWQQSRCIFFCQSFHTFCFLTPYIISFFMAFKRQLNILPYNHRISILSFSKKFEDRPTDRQTNGHMDKVTY